MRNHRYSAIPIITKIVKVVAVLILLFFLYQSIAAIASAVGSWKGGESPYGAIPPVSGFFPRLQTLIPALVNLVLGVLIGSLAWGFGETFSMIRDLLLGKQAETTGIEEEAT